MPLQTLPLTEARAVGGPVSRNLLAGYFGLALLGWLAATGALIAAAPALAAGKPLAEAPVLAAHLTALAFLPLAVTGGTLHLLPVMLRNSLRSEPRLWIALPLLALGGWLTAPGIAFTMPGLLWPGAGLLTAGFALVLLELAGLVVRAPRDRTLVVSRGGIALSLAHAVAALTLGALVFAHGDAPVLGVVHARWLLIHLHVAILGWLALLIVTVGRTLAPMLAVAPTASPRRTPLDELLLALGLWLLAAGIAANRGLAFAGAALVLIAFAHFAALLTRIASSRRSELEGPLAHMLTGALFLVEAATLGLAVLADAGRKPHLLAAYVLLLLVGWAAGVTLGHLPKLLSLSLWVWWPPGPRPKQANLYPLTLARLEAGAFAIGLQTAAVGCYLGNAAATRAGTGLLAVAALLAIATAGSVWQRRSHAANSAA